MRLLIVRDHHRVPMEDCESAGPMIALYGRAPRANRRRWLPAPFAGAVWVAICAWALVGLVFLF